MSQKQTLSQISAELSRLFFAVESDHGGDILALSQDEIERLTTLGDELPRKVDNWIQYLEALTSEIKIYEDRRNKASRLEKSRKAALERLESYLARMIEASPHVDFTGELGTLKARRNPAALEHDLPVARWQTTNIVTKEMLEERPWLDDFVDDVSVKVLRTAELKDALKNGATYQFARLNRSLSLKW